jgi:hypothetical protein
MIALNGLNILIASPEDWGMLRLSKHHYASCAAELGAQVYFLQPPDPSVKTITISPSDQEGVRLVSQPALQKGVRFLPERLRRRADKQRLTELESACSCEFDIIWNFDWYQFRFLGRRDRGSRRMIFQLMDFPSDAKGSNAAVHADLCVGVTKWLCDLLETKGAKQVIRIGHSLAPRSIQPIEHDALATDRLKLACIGNMAIESLDISALTAIVLEHPELDLFLIGPYSPTNLNRSEPSNNAAFEQLCSYSNVYWTGPVPWSDIAGWMDRMDGLLIAYDSMSYMKKASNSHKLLEYLSSGKEILSSYLADLGPEKELILMTSEGEPINKRMTLFLAAIENGPDKLKSEARKEFARARTYEKSTTKILSELLG